jgi:hypothetical protein
MTEIRKRGKLGRLAKKTDERTLQFAKYLKTDLPTAPANVDYSANIADWGMMFNDQYGDCTIAAIGHLIEAWTKGQTIIPDKDILNFYFAITGGQDTGCNELDVLNAWANAGLDSDKIGAFAQVTPTNLDEVKQGIYLFNGLYIGVNLPQSAEDQFQAGENWTVSGDNTIIGGHAVILVGYDTDYVYLVTWGQLVKATWDWFTTYTEESYVLIDNDYFTGAKTAEGFDLDTLIGDLVAISDGTYNVAPVTPPTPPVTPTHLSIWQDIEKWFADTFGKEAQSVQEALNELHSKIANEKYEL